MNIGSVDPTQLESWELLLLRATHAMSLTASQYELIEARYGMIQKALAAATNPLLAEAHIFVQGSVGLKTTIKPAPEAEGAMATIDADAIVWLPNAKNASGQAILSALEERFTEATRVEEPVEPLRRGIRIVYADEDPGFHIDITPARCVPGNQAPEGAGALEVADRVQGWKASSPRPYSAWLENTASMRITLRGVKELGAHRVVLAEASQDPLPDYADYVDGNPLRAAIKLLKRHRDQWAIRFGKEDVRPISAVITTLTALAYRELAASGRMANLRPVEVILEIVDRMPQFIRSSAQGHEVCNPEDSDENFAEKWNRPGQEGQSYKQAFDQWHAAVRDDIRLGLIDQGSDTALRELFVKRFGVNESLVREVVRDIPSTWTLPGRKAGMNRNVASLAALAGTHAASATAQDAVETTGRLG